MKVKFNLLDFGILTIVLVAIFVIFSMFIKSDTISSNQTTAQYEYTIKIANTEKNYTKNLEKDLQVLDGVKNYYYGTLKDFKYEDAKIITKDLENGQYKEVVRPDKADIYLTVIGNGYEADSQILIEGQEISVGKKIIPKVKGFTGIGYVVDLRKVEQ